MFRYKIPQKTFQIGKIKIGGQLGELPTVLIGSIFYKGQKIVKDEEEGIFDKEAAEKLIKRQEELSDIFGNPGILDVVIPSIKAAEKYIDFITKVTDGPFIYDAWPIDVRIKGLKYIVEAGLTDRIIYNSISPLITEDELNAIKKSKIKAAIVFSWNYAYPWAEGLLSVLKGEPKKKGLLKIAEEAGVEKILIDILAGGTIPATGVSCNAIWMIKDETEFPAGYGPGNATTKWMECEKWGKDIFKACESSVHAVSAFLGANFLFYARIESANHIFPACAAADAMLATACMELGSQPVKDHPLYKLFPDVVKQIQKIPPKALASP